MPLRCGRIAVLLSMLLPCLHAAADPTFAAGITTGNTASPLVELSGAAASETNPHVLWVHNDSGDAARVFAISDTGQRLGNYILTGATHTDYEDIEMGPGPEPGISYIYVGDIGDNSENRGTITVYRIPEPAVYTRRAVAPIVVNLPSTNWRAITLDYGASAHNAETLMVDPWNGDLLVGTKEDDQCRVYRATAAQVEAGGTVNLALIATVPFDVASSGAISPRGSEIILRRETFAHLWTRELDETLASALAGTPVSLPVAVEANGEAVTFDRIGDGYFTLTEGNPAPVHYYARTSADGPVPRMDIIAAEAQWQYLDDGTDPGTAWRMNGFVDPDWKTGAAQIGYGEGDELTVAAFGADANTKQPTTYLRKEIKVDTGVTFDEVRLQVLYSSGVAVFLDGDEILRDGLPPEYGFDTLATAPRGALTQSWRTTTIDPTLLTAGTHTISAEVHLAAASQPDMSFDLQLIGAARQYTLNITENELAQGNVSVFPLPNAPDGQRYLQGTTVIMSAFAEDDFAFDHWLLFNPAFPNDPGQASQIDTQGTMLSMSSDQHIEVFWRAITPADGEGDTEGSAGGEGDTAGENPTEGGAEGEGIADGTTEGLEEGAQEGAHEGSPPADGEGVVDGASDNEGNPEGTQSGEGLQDGSMEGEPEGVSEGATDGEGIAEGQGEKEGDVDGTPEGISEGVTEGEIDGNADGEGTHGGDGSVDGEAASDGEDEGEGEGEGGGEGTIETTTQTADQNGDAIIDLAEVLRVIQLFNALALHCDGASEDGYATGVGDTSCPNFDTDYSPPDWVISLSELLRLIQFYNYEGYHPCVNGEDGYCPGVG